MGHNEEWYKKDKSPLQIGPLIPFSCTYTKSDGDYAIVLYGLNPEQVIEDNCAELANLKVIGVRHETIPVPKHFDGEDT